MTQYIVKALNLNDAPVSQRIEAYSDKQASEIVTRKYKYLRVQSVEVAWAWPDLGLSGEHPHNQR